MKKEIKDKWIDALISEEYSQGKILLRTNDNKFCCLGVLCDLYRKEVKDGEWVDINSVPHFRVKEESCRSILPNAVVEWSGLGDENPAINDIYLKNTDGVSHIECLAEANDMGFDFHEIAKIIKKQF